VRFFTAILIYTLSHFINLVWTKIVIRNSDASCTRRVKEKLLKDVSLSMVHAQ